MRGPTEHSTNLPIPAGLTDDRFVYFLTPAGRRVLADHERTTGDQLHLPAAPVAEVAEAVEREQKRRRRREVHRNGRRFGTISYRSRGGQRLPYLRLSGRWLHDAGFRLGQEFEITVEEGRLIVDALHSGAQDSAGTSTRLR